MTDYFTALAERLRAKGIPADRVTATVDDLVAHVADAGVDPETELGPVDEFADQLTARGAPDEAPPSEDADSPAETWRWTADVFTELARLEEFGGQGWEVERIDRLGRFVSHRDRQRPQGWQYRREVMAGGAGMDRVAATFVDTTPITESRQDLARRLAPDGWEPCGRWMCFEYFKRPSAASLGPAAELAAAPARPSRNVYFTRRAKWILGVYAAVMIVFLVGYFVLLAAGIDSGAVRGFLWGAPIGFTLAAVVATLSEIRARRARRSAG